MNHEVITTDKTTAQRVHFDDKIWFHICAYFGNEYGKIRHTRLETFRPIHLFRAVGSASKEDHERLVRYVQLVPQNYYYRKNKPSLLSWFCRYGVKLESIDFYGQIRDDAELAFCLWILKCCNTDDLKSLKVNFCWPSPTRKMVIAEGLEKFAIFPDGIKGASSTKDQLHIMDILAEQASGIETMRISVTSDQLRLPFFVMKNGRHSLLEELTLNIHQGNNVELEPMYQNIANLHCLRRLTLMVGCKNLGNVASHRIESLTLEEIDVRESEADFIVKGCKCPSLKMFRGKYIPRRRWRDSWVGVKAASPITKSEINSRIQNGDFVAFDDDFYGSHTLEYVVGSRPFVGMEVPDSCIVMVDALNND